MRWVTPRFRILAALVALGLLCDSVMPAAAQQVDPFLCYKVKRAKGSEKFTQIPGLALSDRFESGTFDVKKPKELCLPAEVDTETVLDARTRLETYQIKATKGAPKHERLVDFRVVTGLGELFLSTVKTDRLRVPTAADLLAPPAGAPEPA